MKSNYSDIVQSIRVANQAPLDAKLMVNTISELTDLGTDNNRVFTYYRGLIVFCHETKKYYRWTDNFENNNKLLSNDYVYPNGSIFDGIDYSGLLFNFIDHYTQGQKGDKPAHQWQGTQLSFENPDGTWGSYVDLKGAKGDKGDKGEDAKITDLPDYNIWKNIVGMLKIAYLVWFTNVIPEGWEEVPDTDPIKILILNKYLKVSTTAGQTGGNANNKVFLTQNNLPKLRAGGTNLIRSNTKEMRSSAKGSTTNGARNGTGEFVNLDIDYGADNPQPINLDPSFFTVKLIRLKTT